MTARPSKGKLASLLRERIGELATELLGPRTLALSSRTDWRWRAKGSLCLVVAGQKAGSWFDHEAGIGGDAFGLIQRERGCSFLEALAWAAEWLACPTAFLPASRMAPSAQLRPRKADPQDRRSQALHLWAEARHPSQTPAEHYLKKRGLELPIEASEMLRFHPHLYHGDQSSPGLIALFRDLATDEPCGIHRTFLAPDCSRYDRKMLGRVGGAAIKLSPDSEVTTGLGIAEGIETALAVMSTGWRPLWALGSAGAIRRLPVPRGLEALTIFADHDDAGVGEAAAEACAERWAQAGVEVTIATPAVPGQDFNDCLNGGSR
jgi:putative DNA primase/helicase